MADRLEWLTIKIDADASGTTSGAAKAAAAMEKVGEAAEKSKKAIDKMGQATQKVASVMQKANVEIRDMALRLERR